MTTELNTLASVTLVSLVSFIGILAISLREEQLRRSIAFLVPLAIGALLGDAFFHLIPEAFETSEPIRASSFIILGILVFFFLEKFLRHNHHTHHHTDTIANSEKHDRKHLGKLILISDSFHNFIDGVIIGASFLVNPAVGVGSTIAIILHEIPQEIADFGILLYAGYKKTTALLYNFLSAVTAVAGALLVILFGSPSEQLTEAIIPFAAGIFIYIATSDLVPELHREKSNKNIILETAGIGLGLLTLYGLTFLE